MQHAGSSGGGHETPLVPHTVLPPMFNGTEYRILPTIIPGPLSY